MKIKFYIIFLLSFMVITSNETFANAADGVTDKTEKTKIDSLFNLAYANLYKDNEKAILYSRQALNLSKNINNIEDQAMALLYISRAYHISDIYDSAIYYNARALPLFIKFDDKIRVADAYTNFGKDYLLLLKFDTSLAYYNKAYQIYKKLNSKVDIARVFTNIGDVYYQKGNNESALSNFLRALELYEELKNEKGVYAAMVNIGNIYKEIGDYNKSLHYYEKCVRYFLSKNNKPDLSTTYYNIADVYTRQGKFGDALNYYRKCLKIEEERNLTYDYSVTMLAIGDSYESLGNYDSAIYYYHLADYNNKDIDNLFEKASIYNCLGSVFSKTHKIDSAKFYLDSAIILARSINNLELLMDVYNNYSEMYNELGNNNKALEYYKKYSELKDSLYSDENRRKVTDILVQYATDKKEKEIELLNLRNERQVLIRNALLIGIFLFLTFVVILYGRLKKIHRLEIQLKEKNLKLSESNAGLKYEVAERRRTEAELEKAKDQLTKALDQEKEYNKLKTNFVSMVSHEYRTPLTVILASAYLLKRFQMKNDTKSHQEQLEKVTQAAVHMKKLMEDVLILGRHESGRMELEPVKMELIGYCRNLKSQIEALDGFSHKFDFITNADEITITTDETRLNNLLTNLLNNAVKYSPEGTRVRYEIMDTADDVVIIVADSGIGIPKKEQEYLFEPFYRFSNVGNIPGTGLGLTIVKKSVSELGGKVDIESDTGKGTTVIITLPKNNFASH